jgi:hypothetical protein
MWMRRGRFRGCQQKLRKDPKITNNIEIEIGDCDTRLEQWISTINDMKLNDTK